ncbi:polyisoprenoid-binding protein [Roseibium denhamense]|uniref:Polyisoprenoid-binding protein YceI n=1 Tax=Roseibium denhamense TaxID=76305 RepID=A0ABY1NTH3_9HYPH|nr:YceI family protein [Roseibium denhamense]MTI08111.1 polyisoprenoid-binding protein [Roseibium denhamense]SMP16502.1 Polyisoprenoid-binding protein YceI [Roseibium denhamense]
MKLTSLALSVALAAPALTTTHALAETWTVDQSSSSLGFEVQQGTGTVSGTFGTWTATIDFDPDAPETAQISARISPASATTGNAQFDGTLPNKDWFNTSAFPEAEFTATSVERVEGSSYRADGTVTIKGVSQPVTLDFTLAIDGDTAKAEGKATLNRLNYNLGSTVATNTVGEAVTVTLDLTATR